MDQRISLITLGVADPVASAAFYAALGWRRVEAPEEVVVFDLLGQSLGLYPRDRLAEDLGVAAADLGTGLATYAHNLGSRAEVDDLMARAGAAGARIVKPPQEVFWGGYHGVFADPDGHLWEIAHNPFSALGPDGAFRWRGYGEDDG